MLTGAYTGLRFGELAALRTDDFDALRRTLRVDEQLSRQGTGRMVSSPLKNRKARRTIGIPLFVVDELVTQLSTYPSSSDLIFSMPRGASGLLARVCQSASLHSTRGRLPSPLISPPVLEAGRRRIRR